MEKELFNEAKKLADKMAELEKRLNTLTKLRTNLESEKVESGTFIPLVGVLEQRGSIGRIQVNPFSFELPLHIVYIAINDSIMWIDKEINTLNAKFKTL